MMKKIYLAALMLTLSSSAWSAQTPITSISEVTATRQALREAVNTKLGTIESNRADHETRVGALETKTSNIDNTSDASKPVSTATQTALDAKANASCFADTASFNDCFTLDWPTSGITYTAGTGITITDNVIASTVVDTDTFASWDKDYADLINKPTIPDITGLEPSLGNPSVNGYVLSSTTTGVRSWVEMTGGGTGIAHATADGNYYASKDGGWASLTGLYAPALGADDNYVTDAEKTKLAGIAEGAEVNVNADWNASSGDAQILNKPTIPTVSDAAYDATTWDGSTDAPSKNAIRDKIESMSAGGGVWGSIAGTLSAQTDLQNALDAKANRTNISFVAAALSDIKYDPNTSVSNDEFAIIDATATYGGTYDDYQVWPVSKVGAELAGKLATTAIDDTKGNGDTGYVWSADKVYAQLALKEPADATILKSAAIGSTVQGYDADLDDDAIEFVIDGGGSAITTGVKGFLEIPYNATINRVTMVCDQSGSIVVDLWEDSYANYPPTVADTITASAKPTISAATKAQDSTLTGWDTSLAAGNFIGFNVDSASTVTRCTISIKVTK